MAPPAKPHEVNNGPRGGRRWAALLLPLLLVACAEEPLEPLPLEVTVTATPAVAALGDTVRFLVTAQGGSLLGVIIEYGDEQQDILQSYGARTARTTFRHAYAQAGVYMVEAIVADALAGEKAASVTVQIR